MMSHWISLGSLLTNKAWEVWVVDLQKSSAVDALLQRDLSWTARVYDPFLCLESGIYEMICRME